MEKEELKNLKLNDTLVLEISKVWSEKNLDWVIRFEPNFFKDVLGGYLEKFVQFFNPVGDFDFNEDKDDEKYKVKVVKITQTGKTFKNGTRIINVKVGVLEKVETITFRPYNLEDYSVYLMRVESGYKDILQEKIFVDSTKKEYFFGENGTTKIITVVKAVFFNEIIDYRIIEEDSVEDYLQKIRQEMPKYIVVNNRFIKDIPEISTEELQEIKSFKNSF